MIPLIITLFCCALFLAQLVFILAACQTAKRFPGADMRGVKLSGESAHTVRKPDSSYALGGNPSVGHFRECTPALGRILKIQIAQTLAGNGVSAQVRSIARER